MTLSLCMHTSQSCEVSIVSLIFLSMKTPTPYQIHFFIQRQTFFFLNNTPCNRSRIKNPNRGSHKSQSLERVCIYSHALYLPVGGELFQQSTVSFRYNGTLWLSTIWASSRLKVILVEPFVTWGMHHLHSELIQCSFQNFSAHITSKGKQPNHNKKGHDPMGFHALPGFFKRFHKHQCDTHGKLKIVIENGLILIWVS